MSSESPLVSVLVPIYNVERYLRECLNSLVGQTLENIEIICVDDGSTDSSPEILEEYAARDPRIKVISKSNSGYGDSMNKALEQARGEYLAIVESDDFIDEDGIERMVILARENDVEVVKTNFYTHLSHVDYHEDPILPNLEHCLRGEVFDPREHQEIFLTQPAIWSALYRKNLLDRNGITFLPTPGASFQDTSFNFKVFASAQRVFLSDEASLHYRIDNTNSSVKSLSKVFCICDEYAEMWRFLEERGLLEELGNLLAQIQYGGYHWNLHRLTPNLQYRFYQRFVRDFETIRNRGFLNEATFDPGVWSALIRMFSDGDAFFQKELGPIEVKRTCLVQIPPAQPKRLREALLKLVKALSENDEMIVLCEDSSDTIVPMLQEVHSLDARIFDGTEFFASPSFEVLSVAEIRGNEVLAIALDDIKGKTLEAVASWIAEPIGTDKVAKKGFQTSLYEVAKLEQDGRPLLFPLLVRGFYHQTEYTAQELRNYPEGLYRAHIYNKNKGKTSYDDFIAAKAAFDGLVEWLFSRETNDRDETSLQAVYTKVLATLWVELLQLYDTMSYNNRKIFGQKPSPLDYPALDIVGEEQLWQAYEDQTKEQPDHPDISVIIPVFNAQAYLLECLESVLGQEEVLLQVICVDDGSTDESLRILEEIAQVDPRLNVVAQLNGGAGIARNRGIEQACGKYLAFIDPDDYYPSSTVLAKLYTAALENEAKMCGGSFVSFLPSGEQKTTYYGSEAPYTITEEGFRSIAEDQFDYGWIRFIYSRDLFIDGHLRFPGYRWYEDPVFFVDAVALSGAYYTIENPTYCYREDYKEAQWNAVKIRDMLAGIEHNLRFAAENDLNMLYTRLIDRIDHDYGDAILSQIEDEEVLLRMTHIQASLEVDRVAYLRDQDYEVYVLNPLYFRICKERKTAVRRLAEKVEDSRTYGVLQSFYERYRKR